MKRAANPGASLVNARPGEDAYDHTGMVPNRHSLSASLCQLLAHLQSFPGAV